MILLDTHIWVWWVDENPQLSQRHTQLLQDNEQEGLGVSAMSCWEVAKLVERGRLQLACSIEEWMEQAVAYPGIRVLPLTPQIAIESTKLPAPFHRDPADQIIVDTARMHDLSLLTMDRLILDYPHVRTL
jgi:PIN domain nuclease of toxin-antitoxin system